MRESVTMIRPDQLHPPRAMLLVVDMQAKLMPAIADRERVTASACKMIRGAAVLEMPILATEQYPRGIGVTIEPVRGLLAERGAQTVEKPTFSAWATLAVRESILAFDRPQIVLVGVETHVCIQQTALDLASRDYDVFVCADAVGSRGPMDCAMALERMRQNGVIVTTVEGVLFELCQSSAAPPFKALLDIIKNSPPVG
jgi:isochorismate hydrolase